MELNPKQNIENMIKPLVERAKTVGEGVLELTGGLIEVFSQPEVAAKNAKRSAQEYKTMLDLSRNVESNVGNRIAQHEASKQICAETISILKIPEDERTEDNNLDLKLAAYMFDNNPGLMLGIGELSDEDIQMLSNFVVSIQT